MIRGPLRDVPSARRPEKEEAQSVRDTALRIPIAIVQEEVQSPLHFTRVQER